jgi:hypothetical protein
MKVSRKHPARLPGLFVMMRKQDDILVPGSNPDPASPDHAPVKSANDARGGETRGRMRRVLGISITAVALVFIVVWLVAVKG